MEGCIAGKPCQLVVDTGATHTIIRSDLLPKWRHGTPGKKYIITTASGETMNVSGEVEIGIGLGSKTIAHKVFIADIADSVILGMDFMDSHRVILDVGERVMKLGNEEIVMRRGEESTNRIRQVVLTDDLILPARSEVITSVNLECDSDGMVGVLEPVPVNTPGIILARTLISAKTNPVPARIMNLKDFEQKVTEGYRNRTL